MVPWCNFADRSQSVAECAEGIDSLREVGLYLKTRNLFRFAAFQTTGSIACITEDNENTDLQLDVTTTSNGGMQVTARYNPCLFSKARIATILTQLPKIIEGASDNPSQPVGGIDLRTPKQRELLPDPTEILVGAIFVAQFMKFSQAILKPTQRDLAWLRPDLARLPERSFTYKQINEASNILGHLLSQNLVNSQQKFSTNLRNWCFLLASISEATRSSHFPPRLLQSLPPRLFVRQASQLRRGRRYHQIAEQSPPTSGHMSRRSKSR